MAIAITGKAACRQNERQLDTGVVRKASRLGRPAPQAASVVQLAFAEVTRSIEAVMSSVDHGFTVELSQVTAFADGFPLREPLPDAIRRMVSIPLRSVRPIKPACRWPQLLHASMQPMRPSRLGSDGVTFKSDPGPSFDQVLSIAESLESYIGPAQIAAQVKLAPEGYYANIFEHFAVITRSHAALLALMVTD